METTANTKQIGNEDERDLLQEFNVYNMTEEEQQKILLRMEQYIFQKTMSRAVDSLSESDQKEIEDKISNENLNDVQILELLKLKVPEFDKIADEEVDNFRKLSLEIADKIKK